MLSIECLNSFDVLVLAAARGSMEIEKREGESRHPCLALLYKLNYINLLVRTVAIGEVC